MAAVRSMPPPPFFCITAHVIFPYASVEDFPLRALIIGAGQRVALYVMGDLSYRQRRIRRSRRIARAPLTGHCNRREPPCGVGGGFPIGKYRRAG